VELGEREEVALEMGNGEEVDNADEEYPTVNNTVQAQKGVRDDFEDGGTVS
jgi:hypothetical protein